MKANKDLKNALSDLTVKIRGRDHAASNIRPDIWLAFLKCLPCLLGPG